MDRTLSTFTLFDESGKNPLYVMCLSHVSLAQFNIARFNEGWQDGEVQEDQISHEYWKKDSEGNWESTHRDDPDGRPVTVMEW